MFKRILNWLFGSKAKSNVIGLDTYGWPEAEKRMKEQGAICERWAYKHLSFYWSWHSESFVVVDRIRNIVASFDPADPKNLPHTTASDWRDKV